MEIFLTELETYVLVTSAVLASFDGYGVIARISVSTSRRA